MREGHCLAIEATKVSVEGVKGTYASYVEHAYAGISEEIFVAQRQLQQVIAP